MTSTDAAQPDLVDPDEPAPLGDLPAPVRQRIVEWGAWVLGAARPVDVPPSLSRFVRFAPTKRARLAASALAAAVQSDVAFRAMVAEHAAGVAETVLADPSAAAARAYLLRLPEEDELMRAAAGSADSEQTRSRVLELERDLRRQTAKLHRVTAELDAQRADWKSRVEPAADSERLRLRLREQGSRLRELQQRLEASAAMTEERLSVVTAELDNARAEVALWRQRAEAATARADSAAANLLRLRESVDDRRAAADRRLELLLETLEGAATGLRREWSLGHGGPSPADLVAAGISRPAAGAERTADPSRLTSWASLPGAHLIVDGYNVTKTGYPDMPLSDQRDRLIRSLAAFAARTSAEVTVVFDGATVATARPAGRGIRVLFSPAGVIADHVIRDLVRAEPSGRVVIVVSSDREVVDTAARDGARTAPSATLLVAVGS